MNNTNSIKEVFHGLPVEHCPLCGELISIEKSEIMQQEEINCDYCKRSIKSYLPKFDEQLFFTKECNNCERMNNTRSLYCVFCGHDFSYIRKRLKFSIPLLVGIVASSFSIVGIVLVFTSRNLARTIIGFILTGIGFLLGLASLSNEKARKAAIPSMIISGALIIITIVIYLIVFIVF